VQNLLEGEVVSFVIMTGPDSGTLQEGMHFQQRLQEQGLSVGQFVVNRVRPSFVDQEDGCVEDALTDCIGEGAKRDDLLQLVRAYRTLVRADQEAIKNLETQLDGRVGVSAIPFFERELHDLEGLYAFQERL